MKTNYLFTTGAGILISGMVLYLFASYHFTAAEPFKELALKILLFGVIWVGILYLMERYLEKHL